MAELVLGIDTGGTYTDAVLYDYTSRQVVAACKRLTTRQDFALGIEAAIDGLGLPDPSAVRLVSISTTLATNAIAEGKGARVGLFLIGYDPELIASFQMSGRFATPHFAYFAGGHDHFGREKVALDIEGIRARAEKLQGRVDALAISSYFSPLNPEHERLAFETVAAVTRLPVVLGHQLSTKLNSVERATTAALNASLLAVLQEFVTAMGRALQRRGIQAPLMVVRGDGTMVGAEFAARTPVETIHSGPAASAIGGRTLSGLEDALVIDVGGTTTDLALLSSGQVAIDAGGAVVAGFKTAVEAANLLSIGLGGDSLITHTKDLEILVGPQRVIPLAYLANQYPGVRARLRSLAQTSRGATYAEGLEFWVLQRTQQERGAAYTPRQQALLALLQEGPMPLAEVLERLGALHVSQIEAGPLLRAEILVKSALTPTDLLHADGRFTPWDVEAAHLALEIFSRAGKKEPAAVRDQVWTQMTESILHAVLTFLTGRELPLTRLPRDTHIGRWFFYNSLYDLHPQLETRLRLRVPMIGIGAPAGVILPPVAEKLGTDLVLPPHHEVANALGAVAGSVMVAEEVLVYPRLTQVGLEVLGYYVQSQDGRRLIEQLPEALAQARDLSRSRVESLASQAGAQNPRVIVEERQDGLDTFRVRAKAIGSPRLARG